MKKVIFLGMMVLFAIQIASSQNIYKSADVKIKAPLKKNWEYKTDAIILNQRIVNDVCYLNTMNGITAVSLKDGNAIWNYKFPKERGISSVVTFSDKYGVYISYKKGSSALTLVDLSNGKEKWSNKSKENWHKPPAVINDKYVFCIVGEPDDWEKIKDYYDMELSYNEKIAAYNLNDGKESWEHWLDDEESDIICVESDYLFYVFNFDDDPPMNELKCISSKDGSELWEYDPSGMISKQMIGNVKLYKNYAITSPPNGLRGSIELLKLRDGEDIWSEGSYADDINIMNDKIIGYANCVHKHGDVTSWQGFRLSNGNELFHKTIKSSSDIGAILSNFIPGVIGNILETIEGYKNLFQSDDDTPPSLIPTREIFTGLIKQGMVNDKGLFSIYEEDGKPRFCIMNMKKNDEKKIEYKFNQKSLDVYLANGGSETSAFVTTKGKVISFNNSNAKVEWEKDFSNGADIISLGLIIRGDKMYMFTLNSLTQLMNE